METLKARNGAPRGRRAALRAAVCLACALSLAAAAAAPSSDDCLACHDDATLQRADGRALRVEAKPFAESVHGALSCVNCHGDLASAELPHAETLAKVDCATCHDGAVAAYTASIHAEARRAGTMVAATCVDCHGVHDIRRGDDPASRTYALNLPGTCGHCHGDPKIIAAGNIRVGDVFSKYQDSIHGRALSRSGLVVSAKCTDCHGSHDVRRKDDPVSGVHRTHVPATCGKCHEGILAKYASGIHGTRLVDGDTRVPVCSDCHTAHEIPRTDVPGWKLGVLAECGTCHTQSLSTYRDTYHGQVTSLGFERVASCADCHEAHDIHPESDPRSTVSSERRAETCRTCHPSANDRFAAYDPHADKNDRERNPQLYWATWFMRVLLGAVFVFFGLHTSLWFQRLLRGEPAPRPPKAPAANGGS